MSGPDRNTKGRQHTRKTQTLPYARPPVKAAKSWLGGLTSILAPFLGWSSETPEHEQGASRVQAHHSDPGIARQNLLPTHTTATTRQAQPSASNGSTAGANTNTNPLAALPHPLIPNGVVSQPPRNNAFAQAGSAAASSNVGPPPRRGERAQPNNADVIDLLNKSGSSGSGLNLDASQVQDLQNMISQLQNAPLRSIDDEPVFRLHYVPSRSETPATAANEKKEPRMLKTNGNARLTLDGWSSRPRNRFAASNIGSSRGSQRRTMKITTPPSPGPSTRTTAKKQKVVEETPSQEPGPVTSTTTAPTTTTAAPAPTNTAPKTQTLEPPRANGMQQSSNRRLSHSPAPTTPVRPSPLRQTWSAGNDSDSSISSSPSSARGSTAKKAAPTRAAEFMSGLVKDIPLQQRTSAIVNPYESAAPVKPPPRKSTAQRRRPPRAAPAPAALPPPPPVEKVQVTSEQVLAAELPKGAKRSRPTADITNKPEPAPVRRSTRPASPEAPAAAGGSIFAGFDATSTPAKQPAKATIEEVEDEEENPRQKKARKSAPAPAPSSRFSAPTADEPSIEEIDELEESERAPGSPVTKPAEVVEPDTREGSPKADDKGAPKGSAAVAAAAAKTHAPARPSKLRFEYQAESPKEESPKEKVDAGKPAELALEPKASAFSFALPAKTSPPAAPAAPAPSSNPISAFSTFAATPAPSVAPAPQAAPTTTSASSSVAEKDPKKAVLSLSADSLPSYDFTLAKPGESSKTLLAAAGAVGERARSVPVSELPAFSFEKSAATSVAAAPSGGFNWEAAGMKVPAAAAAGEWTCDLCSCKNPASATDKCTVCEAPPPASVKAQAPAATAAPPPAPAASFNWAAAGMEAPAAASGEWTCEVCSCKNPESVTDKCTVCEAAPPAAVTTMASAAAPAAPAVVGFNWAAAGVTPQGGASGGAWTCGQCMLQNPASATDQCTICEAKRT